MKRNFVSILLFSFTMFLGLKNVYSWGFYSHRLINRHAVFCLPSEMILFYKTYIEYITEHSADPDKMSRIVEGEAAKHYLDVEHYGENPFENLPIYWKDAVAKFSEDTLMKHGILPWNISLMLYRLTDAFKREDVKDIIKISAHLGHYVADANTPLHTTKFYNGRTPEQKGIHAFWETRIPELLANNFSFFVGKATYIENGQKKAWEMVKASHKQVDSIYLIYEHMINVFPPDKLFVFDSRANAMKREYSREFSIEFEKATKNMVERNMRNSILSVASYWYTAWVNAGQPDLRKLIGKDISAELQEEIKQLNEQWKINKPKGRPNPEDEEF